MEFLLILSAVLSAVTGAFTGARGPEARLHHAAPAQTAAAAETVAEVAVPAAPIMTLLPAVARIIDATEFRPFALAASVPLYANRLIE